MSNIIKFTRPIPPEEFPEVTHCSFCKKDKEKCKRLITSPPMGAGICDECAKQCAILIKEEENVKSPATSS